MKGLGITEPQLKFIKIKADSGTGSKSLTHQDIADMLGVTRQAVNNWSVKPEIKEAIKLRKEREPENIYPEIMKNLEDTALGRGRGITTFAKIRASELWLKAGGYLKKPKGNGTGDSSEKEKSIEKKLMELED